MSCEGGPAVVGGGVAGTKQPHSLAALPHSDMVDPGSKIRREGVEYGIPGVAVVNQARLSR